MYHYGGSVLFPDKKYGSINQKNIESVRSVRRRTRIWQKTVPRREKSPAAWCAERFCAILKNRITEQKKGKKESV